MQTDYAPECLYTDVPSKEALLAAAQDGSILQATAARCDVQHNLILPLDGMTGIMPREECALGIDTGTTREIAILSRVGKPVSFQVLRIRGDVAYVSRRRAQQRADGDPRAGGGPAGAQRALYDPHPAGALHRQNRL